MKKYRITGMSCAACSARVEKAVLAVEGVSACAVNLLTNSMTVEATAEPAVIIAAVEAAGYGAAEDAPEGQPTARKISGNDRTEKRLFCRLITSIALLLPLLYLSMGHVMWSFPIPTILAQNPMAIGLLELLLAALVMVINQRFFINGFWGLIKHAPNMDTLIALGSSAAFLYSTYLLFEISYALLQGNPEAAFHHLHGLYFESAAMILSLITVGKALEARAKGKTTDALEALINLAPKTATVLRNGKEETVPVDQILKGEIFIVRPGEAIPADGIVRSGYSAVNESAMTGESIPIEKCVGDGVSAGTLNQSGVLQCEAVRIGEDTALSQIIRMVSDAAATKAPIAKIADRVAGIFVPVIISIATVATVAWMIATGEIGFSLARGISVLVISCPCALGLATPVAIMVGTGMGAKNGILFKNATALEALGRVNCIALDKTGTITKGSPVLTDLIVADGSTSEELLTLAASLEKNSEHPLAKAVLSAAEERTLPLTEVLDFKILPGSGLSATLDGKALIGGSLQFLANAHPLPPSIEATAERLSMQGKTPILFAYDNRLLGMLAVADTVKEDSASAIAELKSLGIHTVMLTGDNPRTASAIGAQVGVDEVLAGVRPDEKEQAIRRLQERGGVAMVGDGINDAPALTRADVGIAIGAGSDIALDSADVVLMNSTISDVSAAIRLSRLTLRNIRQNLFWAFFYNALGIPLAAGVFIPLLGWTLDPMFGAAAMSLSSVCVVGNALRIRFFHKKTIAIVEKEKKEMKKTIKIEGMMCPHCEMHVKKALEALDGVTEAIASHKDGTATVTLSASVANSLLQSTVEAAGYTVLSID